MTNTLHRFGDAESFHDDYVIFAIASKGSNDQDSLPKLNRFLQIAVEFKPVNLGTRGMGSAAAVAQHEPGSALEPGHRRLISTQ